MKIFTVMSFVEPIAKIILLDTIYYSLKFLRSCFYSIIHTLFATSFLQTCNRRMSRQAVLRHANTQMIHLNEYHYMLNNKNLLFRYHKFLDVDSNKVERTIEG